MENKRNTTKEKKKENKKYPYKKLNRRSKNQKNIELSDRIEIIFLIVVIVLLMLFVSQSVSQSMERINDKQIDYKNESIELIYQGPVQIGYNISHFRLTGEMIKNGES